MSHWSPPWTSGSLGNFFDPKTGITFVTIPAGTIEVYSPKHDRMVPITLPKPIMVSQTLITQSQYARVMREEPNYRFIGHDKPVDSIVYGASKTFCEAVGGRLPTDAEYVYAAMGHADPAWARLGVYGAIHDIAWYAENSLGMTHSVGGKRPNSFGLYDMLGNVAVWTSSSADGGRSRKVYGASWASPQGMVRVTNNFDVPHRTENASIGFRCVMDVIETPQERSKRMYMLEMEEMSSPPAPASPQRDKRIAQIELDGMPRSRRRRR